ncbi:PREDICTED: uclacyanin-3-like [Nicotiana attenuata]|uniref:Uclacyanin-3 n=1 Tax=Nicotiana attenuata TaxID=49451 RepID=A0A1J6IG21_NICAT|nr:PREDICTED: uclacyanin-3-like [Nicotiana attenuata]OIT03822.1 uclacyanin-3 [Nicotiana attenuata]
MAVAATIFQFLLLASPLAFAKEHIVGGSNGWSQSVDYSSWASGETFNVGDTLVFNYDGSHGVDIVTKDGYDNCNTANAIKSFSDGSTTITLASSPVDVYFVCPKLNHCATGMKLAIKVQGTSSGSGSGSGPGSGSTAPTTKPNGASGVFGAMSKMVVGFSVVFGALFAFLV